MSQASSSHSPLAFARDYQAYRRQAATVPFADTRLLAAARFWLPRHAAIGDPAYESYWREDLPDLCAGAPDLQDLLPAELEEVAAFLEAVSRHLVPAITADTVWEMAACGWMYVGDAPRAWSALSHTPPGQGLGDRAPTVICEDARDLPQLLIDAMAVAHSQETHSSSDSDNRQVTARHALMDWLVRFDAGWQADRDSAVANEALCVLVEYDGSMRPVRGRLRRLRAKIEILGGAEDADQVIFAHQLRAADDSQISGAYAALAALRDLTRRNTQKAEPGTTPTVTAGAAGRSMPLSRFAGSGPPPANKTTGPEARARQPANGSPLRGHFEFLDHGHELYGGDSLGFACLAAAFGDHWSRMLHRERRLVAAAVALSGALEPDGRAAAVSQASLACKVERVFFSPISALAVPGANRAAAEASVEQLRQQHPARRLRIIGIERAADLIADHYIFLPERVCLGEYAVLAAAKYSRNVRVQVPLLAIVGYLLLCLLYPQAWPWADRNPALADFAGSNLVVRNAGRRVLWKQEFNPEIEWRSANAMLGNLDNDRPLEVACLVMPRQQASEMRAGELIVFDDDGTELFRRAPAIPGQYPGDSTIDQEYDFGNLAIVGRDARTRIVTTLLKSNPARTHLMVWNPDGTVAGWYINAGFAGGKGTTIVDTARSLVHAGGLNNRVSAACLFSVFLDSCVGVSPPYEDPELDLHDVKRGNQVQYILFPVTDLCRARGARQNYVHRLVNEGQRLRVHVDEMGEGRATQDSLATIWYYVDEDLRVVSAICDDAFVSMRQRLVALGALPPVDMREYQQALVRDVRYWSDTGWIRLPPESAPLE